MREDRILDEVHASGGDLRRLMDLFGLTAQGAQRFTATLGHPLLTLEPGTVPAEDQGCNRAGYGMTDDRRITGLAWLRSVKTRPRS